MVAHRAHLPLIDVQTRAPRGSQLRLGACLMLALAMVSQSAHTQPITHRGVVRTDSMWSQALGTTKQLVVYLPPSYADAGVPARRYPLAVYLHGGWGNETDWTAKGQLATIMDSLVASGMREMIVVMPDGDDGWWTTWHALPDLAACRRTRREENADSYCVPWPKYDDYVAHDVIAHTDSLYRTLPRRASRGIAGVSMGGYGAITIAARNPATFAAAASHSGVLRPAMQVDNSTGTPVVRDARTRDELRTVSGRRWAIIEPAFGSDSISWITRDPSHLIEQMLRRGDAVPSLFVDVGTEDHVLPMNRSFRDRMAQLKVPVTYAEWPGTHDWPYWRAHLPASLRFLAERLAP